jgi:hypothetical protein
VVFDEYRVGLDLMYNAAFTMAAQTMKGQPGAEQMAEFSKEAGGYIEQNFKHLWAAISQIESPGQMLPWPGDIFDVARSPGIDPMWRTEAALKMGRMRWMKSVTPADQVGANRLLKQLADDPSAPLSVRSAAAAGRDLTVEKFRMY